MSFRPVSVRPASVRIDPAQPGSIHRERVRPARVGWAVLFRGIPLLMVALLLSAATGASAQDVQVPLDTDGRVQTITRAMAERLHLLLDEHPALAEARLFREGTDVWFLEVTSLREGELVRERQPLTPGEAAELRRQVTERLVAYGAPGAAIGPRALLVGTYSGLGLFFYDWAVPFILNVEDGRAASGLGLLTAGASFCIPYLATSGRPVTYGEAEMVRTGAVRGLAYGGILWALLQPQDDEGEGRGGTAIVLGASLAGGMAGSRWACVTRMTPGTAAMLANGSDFGMLAAAGVLVLSEAKDGRGIAGGLLAGGVGGTAAAYRLARPRTYSWGDAQALRDAGLLGAFVGAAMVNWSDTEDEKSYAGGALAGMAAGLVVGDRLVQRTELSGGQAVLIELGTVAGSVVGVGLARLLVSDDADGSIYLTSAAAGAVAGYALTFRAMRRYPRAAARSVLELQVNPFGLAALRGRREGARRDRARGDLPRMPLLSVSCRF